MSIDVEIIAVQDTPTAVDQSDAHDEANAAFVTLQNLIGRAEYAKQTEQAEKQKQEIGNQRQETANQQQEAVNQQPMAWKRQEEARRLQSAAAKQESGKCAITSGMM